MNFNHASRLLIITVGLLMLNACQNVLEGVRTVTYPPDFNYISRQKLTGTMQQFALYTTLLDQALRGSPEITEEQRKSAISVLTKMEKLSLQLATEKLTSNHDMVSHNIDRFRSRIANARRALLQEPPSYYQAGSVSAYCLSCHALGK